jgi:hypothetical protein
MSKKHLVWSTVLLTIGGSVAIVLFVWRPFELSRPARKIVGTWGVLHSSSSLEKEVTGAVEKKDPELAKATGDQFRSTESVVFDRNGAFRFSQDFAGMTIMEEGTWKATERSDGKLSVQIHKTKLSLRNPQKQETKDDAQDATIEWVVSVDDGDHLSVTMTPDDGKSQSFRLGRVKQ